MDPVTTAGAMLVLLQVKHFFADYLWQPGWMLAGKGDVTRLGGYAHAATHAVCSLPALAVAGLAPTTMAAFMAAEFAAHYAIDHGKAALSRRSHVGPDKPQFWALHGADQLLHHLTYAAMVLAA